MGLIAIAMGCWKLEKFELVGCKRITRTRVKTLTSLLRREEKEEELGYCIEKEEDENMWERESIN